MTTTTAPTLSDIEDLTKEYARCRNLLKERMDSLQEEIRSLQARRMRGIRSALNMTLDAGHVLENSIASNPHLFKRPRTVTIEGIRVGITKSKGQIKWDDDAKVVALIEKHFPHAADTLVKTTRKPIKSALSNLTTAELKKLGCYITETGDSVIIKCQDSLLEKLVDRMLEDGDAYDENPEI